MSMPPNFATLDATMQERFAPSYELAIKNELESWKQNPEGKAAICGLPVPAHFYGEHHAQQGGHNKTGGHE